MAYCQSPDRLVTVSTEGVVSLWSATVLTQLASFVGDAEMTVCAIAEIGSSRVTASAACISSNRSPS